VLPAAAGTGFAELSRRRGDYAVCGVAVVAWLGPDGTVGGARAAYLSVGPVPLVLELTATVAGATAGADDFPGVAGLVRAQLDPEPDIHATAEYRRHLAGVLTVRALREAVAEARQRTSGEGA
jgi:aerobic carbon-monoxide dehydrogenase medium subunit